MDRILGRRFYQNKITLPLFNYPIGQKVLKANLNRKIIAGSVYRVKAPYRATRDRAIRWHRRNRPVFCCFVIPPLHAQLDPTTYRMNANKGRHTELYW